MSASSLGFVSVMIIFNKLLRELDDEVCIITVSSPAILGVASVAGGDTVRGFTHVGRKLPYRLEV